MLTEICIKPPIRVLTVAVGGEGGGREKQKCLELLSE